MAWNFILLEIHVGGHSLALADKNSITTKAYCTRPRDAQ